jgi:heptose I phosphotransferase
MASSGAESVSDAAFPRLTRSPETPYSRRSWGRQECLPHGIQRTEAAVLDGLWTRLTRGARRLIATPEWERVAGADWADTILGAEVTDRYFAKQGRSIGRWTLTRGQDRLVVYLKRHYFLPWLDRLRALIWPSGDWSAGMMERRKLEIARRLEVPVPRVAAAAEFIGPGLRLQSALAVEELTGMLALHEAVPLALARLGAVDFARWKRGLTVELVRLCRLMHDRSWFHKDLYFCHFYLPEADTCRVPADWLGRVHMIDFHRLARRRLTASWWLAKDLGQLLYSSDVAGVTDRDRLRFWSLYTKGRAGLRMRLVRHIIELRARNNQRHNERRPALPKAA